MSIWRLATSKRSGGVLRKPQKVDYVNITINEKKVISTDNIMFIGNRQIERSEPIITIFDNSDDSNCIFEGTHQQLVYLIANKK